MSVTLSKPFVVLGGANGTTSSAVIADNVIVRGDGGARGVQGSPITIADTTGAMSWDAAQNALLSAASGRSLTLQSGGANAVVFTSAQDANFAGIITGATNVTAGAGAAIGFTGRSAFTSPVNSELTLSNAAQTAFAALNFSPTTTAVYSSRRQKIVGSIADATATTVLTITVPNAAHSAIIYVRLGASLGAGGAIGANEASQNIIYAIGITRTAGVAMNAVISTAFGSSGSVAVAGAATITATAALTLNAEGVGVTNTASLKVTITKGSGSSANHTCLVIADIGNANASGVTIS